MRSASGVVSAITTLLIRCSTRLRTGLAWLCSCFATDLDGDDDSRDRYFHGDLVEKSANPIHLLLLPIAFPLVMSFALLVGYIGLFLGRVLAASAYGEDDHPRWPDWDIHEVGEGLGRWIWAIVMGVVIGGFPAMYYWINCGDVDTVDKFIFIDLAALGTAYGLMALAASLLHENILSANPLAVLLAIKPLGWDYVGPCVLSGLGIVSAVLAWRFVLFHAPSLIRCFWDVALLDLGSISGNDHLPGARSHLPQTHRFPGLVS